MSLPLWMRLGKDKFVANSPTILSGLAVGGLVATVAFAVRATSKASVVIEENRDKKEYAAATAEERAIFDGDKRVTLTRQEIVQATWKLYIPASIAGAASIACIVGANQVGLRQKAALAGAYSLAELAFREYKDEVIQVLGAKKDQEITERITERKIQASPPDAQVIIVGGDNDQLCYDTLTGRYFRSSAEKIRRAELDLRGEILNDMYCDHNRFYDLLDLECVVIGDALGWNINHQPKILLGAHMSPQGTPCLAIQWQVLPIVDYLKFS